MGELVTTSMLLCSSELMADAFRRIFADTDTPSPPSFDAAAFERRFGFEDLDRSASCVVLSDQVPVATILTARRGRCAHVSGLGVSANFRARGIGTRLLRDAINKVRKRGARSLTVEVASLFGCSLPTQAYSLDDAAFGIVTTRPDGMNLRAIFVRPQLRRRGLGGRLLRAMAAHENASTCTVLPFVPDGPYSDFFRALGFAETTGNSNSNFCCNVAAFARRATFGGARRCESTPSSPGGDVVLPMELRLRSHVPRTDPQKHAMAPAPAQGH